MHQISFEFFPPKTDEGMNNLAETAIRLAAFNPHFFSVTFGAGGSTRNGTLETLRMLMAHTRAMVSPHLSCISSTRAELVEMIEHYQHLGVKQLVALRGDMPSGAGQAGDFRFASELVSLIRETTAAHFKIAVAAYPEIHPQAVSVCDDIANLKRKCDAGANSAITQYFFNADGYFYYRDECQRAGIDLPIIPGIMPITQFSRLERFSDACGAEIPRWIRKRLQSYGDDLQSIQQFGTEVVTNLCQQLLVAEAPGLHFYTLNKADATIQILEGLNLNIVPMKEPMQKLANL